MCAAAVHAKCLCACGGKNHGKFRYLKAERDAKGPWSAAEARRQLQLAQDYLAQGILPPSLFKSLPYEKDAR